MISGTTKYRIPSWIIILLIALSSGNVYSQDNEILAKSYYLKAEKSYDSGKYSDALESLDKTVGYLGSSNAKIEALYVEILLKSKDYKSAQLHLTKYFNLADNSRPDYQEMLLYAAEINDKIEAVKKAQKEREEKQRLAQKQKEEARKKAIAKRKADVMAVFNDMSKYLNKIEENVKKGNKATKDRREYLAEEFIINKPQTDLSLSKDETLSKLEKFITKLDFESDTLTKKDIMNDKPFKSYKLERNFINYNNYTTYGYTYKKADNGEMTKNWYIDYLDLNDIIRIDKEDGYIRIEMLTDTYATLWNKEEKKPYKEPKTDFRYWASSNLNRTYDENNQTHLEIIKLFEHLCYLNRKRYANTYQKTYENSSPNDIKKRRKLRPYKSYIEKTKKEKPTNPLRLSWKKTVKKINDFIKTHHIDDKKYKIDFKGDNIITTKTTFNGKRKTKTFNWHDLDIIETKLTTYPRGYFNLNLKEDYFYDLEDLMVNKDSWVACCGIDLKLTHSNYTSKNFKSDANYKELTDLLRHLIYLNRNDRVKKIKELFPNDFE